MRDIPIPNDWDPETDGWETALVCVPNSDQWRAVVLGALQGLTYGRLWERESGNIIAAQEIANQIVEGVQMSCNDIFQAQADFMERIAIAVEGIQATTGEWYDSQYISLVDFWPIISTLPLGAELIAASDLFGEIFEALNLLPDLNIKIPIQDAWHILTDGIFRRKFLERINDLIAATHGIGVGTAGPTIAAVIEQYFDDLPGLNLIDYILGNVDESIIRSVGLDLPTLLLGNYMTNKTDDVRNAIDGGSIIPGDDVVNQLKNIGVDVGLVAVGAAAIGAAVDTYGQGIQNELTEWLSQLVNQTARLANRPECGCPAGGTEEDAPPVDDPIEVGDPGFPEQSDLDIYRCKGAFLTWYTFRSFWFKMAALSVFEITAMGLSGLVGLVVGALIASGIGIPIAAIVGAVVALAGKILQTASFQSTDIVNFFDERQDDIICALFTGPNEDAARTAIQAVMDDYGLLTSLEEEAIMLLCANTVFGRIYAEDLVITDADAIEYDCAGCFQTGECPFTIGTGSGTPRYDDIEWIATAADVGGGVYVLEMLTDAGCVTLNWCAVFTYRDAMNNTSANYTRKLYSTANDTHSYNFEDFDWNSDPADCFPDLDREYPISGMTFASDAPFTVGIRLVKTVAATDFDPSDSTACD